MVPSSNVKTHCSSRIFYLALLFEYLFNTVRISTPLTIFGLNFQSITVSIYSKMPGQLQINRSREFRDKIFCTFYSHDAFFTSFSSAELHLYFRQSKSTVRCSDSGDSKASPPGHNGNNKEHLSSIVREISQARLLSLRKKRSGQSMTLGIADNGNAETDRTVWIGMECLSTC